jgi:RNA polymerase sigma-70 factor (ECF subfamily)
MPEPTPERDLIASFRNGDRWAMEYLYGLHNKTLCYFAATLTKNHEQAEEIVSDTFIKLFRLRLNFDSHTNIRAFLYITVRNACFNAIRLHKRITRAQQEMLYLMQNEADHQEFDDIETSLLEKVYAEIDMLPKQAQQVFKLIFVERKSTAEIAQIMNLSRNTVQNHRIRAMKLLRTALLKKKLFPLVVGYSSFCRISPYLAGLAGWLGFS